MKKFPILLSLINKICQWKIDGIIGVAPLCLKYFKDYTGPKIVLPNGIDLEIFNPKVQKIKKYTDGKINILFLGRIEKRKGLIYLLKAYKILEKNLPVNLREKLRLIIGGQGPLKEDLEKWVRINKLKNVIFEGKISEEKAPSFYRSCDIYCSPAIFGESFGLVLLEAMACQKPVVAFANEGYKTVLTGKGARFLVKPRDYKTLAQKLEILIKNEKLRREMSNWGLQEVQKYSWTKIASQILNFYQICQQDKQKREKKKAFSLEKQINKIFNKMFKSFQLWQKIH
jgi:phosphatidylinositol alpha-mannosyltransferase